jgi:small subunit ribosomal protein S21
MSEVRVKENESLDSALRRFKRSCAVPVFLQKFANVSIMKSPASNAKRNPKLPEKGNADRWT